MSATSPTVADRLPPHVFFVVSAVFHYLGPSFAVLLFAQLAPSGVVDGGVNPQQSGEI
jgi:inner membrane transporter RhtA